MVFAVHFTLISLVNHQCFRTYALDLGMFSNEMYQYGLFIVPELTLGLLDPMPILADHWAPILVVFSPLRYLFGSYTLLIIQIAALLMAATYIYRIALWYKMNSWIAAGASLFFLSMWGITSALAFDFHTNVLAACFFPLLYFYLLRNDLRGIIIITVIILLTKENMGFWLAFVFLGFWVRGWYLKAQHHKLYLGMAVISLGVFIGLVFGLIPHYAQGQHHNLTQFFGHISPDMKDVVWYFLTHPLEIFKLLYLDELGNISTPKMDSIFMMAVSGLIFIFWRPWFLVIIIPLIAQKFLTGYDQISGIHGQYSIEFAPIAAFAFVVSLAGIQSNFVRGLLIMVSVGSAFYYNYREIFPHNERTNVWDEIHYTSVIDPSEFKTCQDLLPPDASLCCSSQMASHLPFRRHIYHYPIHGESEYILLVKHTFASYPETGERYLAEIEQWIDNENVSILFNGKDLLLLKKNNFTLP